MRTVLALAFAGVASLIAMAGPAAPTDGQFIYRLPSSGPADSSTLCEDAVTAGTIQYIDAAATGTGSGDSWANAWTTFTEAESEITRGQVACVADGTYDSVTFNVATSGTTTITFKKATVADHGSDTGWVDSMGNGQAIIDGRLRFESNYWVIDGATGGGPNGWTSGFGFYIDRTALSDGSGVQTADGVTNITLRHTEIAGHGPDGGSPVAQQDGLNILTGSGHLFSSLYIHDTGRTIVFSRADSTVFEYLYTGKFESCGGTSCADATDTEHAEAFSIWKTGIVSGVTLRWSVITHGEGTGGFLCECDDVKIYGNVFVKLAGTSWQGNGAVGTWTADTLTNLKVYNNSFIDVGIPIGDFNSDDSGEFINNVFYSTSDIETASFDPLTHSFNHYVDSVSPTEATKTSGTGDPFTDYLNLNFGLIGNTTAGTDLGSPYNVDLCGTTRTTWTRGALEFGSGC